MAAIAGAAIAAGASILGSGIGAFGSAKAAKAQKAEAERNRQHQTSMYMHRYQWQMEDMRKAGLNPILSYKTGAPGGTGGGGGVSPVNVGAPIQAGIQSAISTALAAKRQSQELKNMKEQENTERSKQQLNYDSAGSARMKRQLDERNRQMLEQTIRIRRADEASARAAERFYSSDIGQIKRKWELLRRSAIGGKAPSFGRK